MEEYKTVITDSTGEITEKKSRFIATLHHTESEDEAVLFVNEMKKKYWDARHNCSAFITGLENAAERANDDGEPSRTAGFPILESIKNAGLHNVCLVVTRYFGGILLGTGGLTRAYREAAQAAIDSADTVTMRMLYKATAIVDYDTYGKLRHETEKKGYHVISTDFEDLVKVGFALRQEESAALERFILDITRGERKLIVSDPEWFQMAP